MHRTFRVLLLLSIVSVTFMLAFPKSSYSSPAFAVVDARPQNHTITGGLSVGTPGAAYDNNLATAASFRYDPGTAGTFEVHTFTQPSSNPIAFVDLKMNYGADAGGTGEQYRIVYYVGASGPIVLVPWTGAAHAPSTVVWTGQSEPNDGTWDWTDISNIKIVVETLTGGRGASDFDEYEAWASVTTYQSATISVNPASLTDPSSPFTVNINISSVDDLYGWEFKLYYNNTILSNSTVVEETFLSSAGSTQFFVLNNTDTYNATHGRFWVTCTRLGNVAGVSGSGRLANITFTVDGQGGTTPLTLADTKLVGYDQPNTRLIYMVHSTTDGQVTISGGAVPEFPFGAALEIALAGIIVYIWWKGKRRQMPRLPSNS